MKTAKWVLSVPEAGAILGLGRSASYEAARRGDIPVVQIGRKLIVPIAKIEEILGETIREVGTELLEGEE